MALKTLLLQSVVALSLFISVYAQICPLEVASCHANGDPHYTTFDGRLFDFMGLCRYVIAKPCKLCRNDIDWSVEATNFACGTTVSCIDTVFVKIYGMEFVLDNYNVLQINPGPPTGPVPLPYTFHYSATQFVTVTMVGGYISLTTDFGLNVARYGYMYNFQVDVPKDAYFGNTCGLCGLLNNNPRDDFVLPNGGSVKDPDVFGDSWNVDPTCKGVKYGRRRRQVDPCTPDMQQKAQEICSVIKNENFSPCHSVVDPTILMETCITDVCHMDDKDVVCGTLSEYARQCRLKGITIKWRLDEFCPLKCPDSMVYSLNGPTKTPTCEDGETKGIDPQNPKEEIAVDIFLKKRPEEDRGIEGCFCPDGQVLYENRCIDPRECP